MITLDKLIEAVSQSAMNSKHTRVLPNDQSKKYIQKSAVDIRIDELNSMLPVDNSMSQFVNYTMDTELIKDDNNDSNDNIDIQQKTLISDNVILTVPNNCLITYIENSIATTPTIINDAFKYCNMSGDEWFIYGFKNPESLCKSLLILTTTDFMLKNKNDRRNDVLTIKREMAVNLDIFYKKLGYKSMKFNRTTMMESLMNKDNYITYDFMTLSSDYYKVNLIILDIIKGSYMDITCKNHKFSNSSINSSGFNNTDISNGYMVIIKYTNNTFLPIMSNKCTKFHIVPKEFINFIKTSYELEPVEPLFKYRTDVELSSNNTNTLPITNDNIEITLKSSPSIETVIRNSSESVLSQLDSSIPIHIPTPKKNEKDNNIIDSNNNSNNNNTDEQTKNLNMQKNADKMTLGELQSMAQSKGINIDKLGKTAGKMVRKTKLELYTEINQIS